MSKRKNEKARMQCNINMVSSYRENARKNSLVILEKLFRISVF
jgi:hypothetical protein